LSTHEVAKYISKLKNNKAPGPDFLTNEHIKTISPNLINFYTIFFNLCIDTCSLPNDWKHSYLKILYKNKGDLLDLNNYRGLALSCTHYKLFDSIINGRIFAAMHHVIPDTQFGFMPGRSTIQAIALLHNKIIETVTQKRESLYVIFIDFQKAFDSVNRSILFQKLIDSKLLPKKLLLIIANMLDVNLISIHDGLLKSNEIIQSNGVLQGAVSSPLLFNLLTSSVKGDIFGAEGPIDGDELDIYADDKALICKSRERIQSLLNLLTQSVKSIGLTINESKTKVMKFRKGGNLCKSDIINCNNKQLEFVSSFKYLGITFQQSGTTFTMHIKEKYKSAIAASYTIGGLNLLSIDTAIKLFYIKIAPIASYGITIIWPYLKHSDFRILESVKSMYLKRVLSVSKYSRNRLVYQLCDCQYFVTFLKTQFNLCSTPAYESFIIECNNKVAEIDPCFYQTPAFLNQSWKKPHFNKRHTFTRYSMHGFHHLICVTERYHEFNQLACKCKLCNENMNSIYHFQTCTRHPRLAEYAGQ
jgi:hypothetical protein